MGFTNASDEIQATHRNLAAASRQFIDYVRDNPAAARRLEYRKTAAPPGLNIPDWALNYFPYPLQSWPLLVGEEKLQEIRRAAVGVMHLIKSIPERVFGNDPKRVSEFLGIPSEWLAMLFIEPPNGLQGAVCRCDLVDDGRRMLCIEANMSANIGGWQIRFWQQLCRSNPPIARFFEQQGIDPYYRDPLPALFSHIVEDTLDSPAADSAVNIAFAFDPEALQTAQAASAHLNAVYSEVLSQRGRPVPGRILACQYPTDFEVRQGRLLYHQGLRVHALVECSDVQTPEMVFRCFKTGKLRLYNSPLSRFLGSKKSLALLSELEDSDLFDSEERAIIRDHIPWSRSIDQKETTFRGQAVHLPELLMARQEEFVIKPQRGSQGEDVYVGRYTSPEQWRRRVAAAADQGGWLIQEYAESRPYLFQHEASGACPHEVVWGVFCFGSAYGGGFLRMSPRGSSRGIINSARGAVEGFIFEV